MGKKQKNRSQQRKKKKKQKRRSVTPSKRVERMFLEGADSYKDEYERLLKNPVSPPIVVREIDGSVYRDKSSEQLLIHTGFSDYKMIIYNLEYDNSPSEGNDKGSAVTIAGITDKGIIRPFVFIDKDIRSKSVHKDSVYCTKTWVLLHEYGHAIDIIKSIHYDHSNKQMDIISNEIHAYQYAINYCRKHGYRLACGECLDNIEIQKDSPSEYLRIVANKFFSMHDTDKIRKWTQDDYLSNESSPYYKEAVRRRKEGTL